MSQDQNTETAFPNVFGAVGYAFVCVVVLAGSIELVSSIVNTFFTPRIAPPFYEGHCRGAGGGKCATPPKLFDMNLNSASSAYDKAEWAEAFWHEEREHWGRLQTYPYKPYLVWGNPEWNGRFDNFDRTDFGVIRRTANPTPGCPTVIWTFGGST